MQGTEEGLVRVRRAAGPPVRPPGCGSNINCDWLTKKTEKQQEHSCTVTWKKIKETRRGRGTFGCCCLFHGFL